MAAAKSPKAGIHYPRDWDELSLWFPDDAACLDYLEWVRWPEGFVCRRCSAIGGWRGGDGKWNCSGCKTRTSATAGTIFDRSKVPLTTWFTAAWYVTNQKHGASALGVKRVTGVAYQTAWTMLHKLRAAMARPGREPLSGNVEVDETLIGGVKPGKRGRGAKGKALVAVAVETKKPKRGYGRIRMEVIPAAEAVHLLGFVKRNIAPGATVITDGWKAYARSLPAAGYRHEPINVSKSGKQAHELLPGVHRVSSLVKRWLLGTHQGAVEHAHLQSCLDEFCFRSNRRHSRQRGLLFYRLLQLAVVTDPVTYDELRKGLRTTSDARGAYALSPPVPPPSSTPRQPRAPVEGRPWRQAAPM
ncbi:MAG: IS1595 family transposase [Thermoanaerobaculia bacterium]